MPGGPLRAAPADRRGRDGTGLAGLDIALHRPVAVKVLRSEYTGDPTFLARFRAEAQHAASLSHPNIAAVFDYGEEIAQDGTGETLAYLVMELVEGEPLSTLVQREGRSTRRPRSPSCGRPPSASARRTRRHGAPRREAGQHPGPPRRRVKITDFGIAWSARSVALTRTGQVIGTPQYLSPEQAEGSPATPASDVYALGLIGYECLTGHPAFEGDNAVTIALKQVREDPSRCPAPAGRGAGADRPALLKDPPRASPDGAAFVAAIDDVLAGRPLRPTVAPAAATGEMPVPAATSRGGPRRPRAPGGRTARRTVATVCCRCSRCWRVPASPPACCRRCRGLARADRLGRGRAAATGPARIVLDGRLRRAPGGRGHPAADPSACDVELARGSLTRCRRPRDRGQPHRRPAAGGHRGPSPTPSPRRRRAAPAERHRRVRPRSEATPPAPAERRWTAWRHPRLRRGGHDRRDQRQADRDGSRTSRRRAATGTVRGPRRNARREAPSRLTDRSVLRRGPIQSAAPRQPSAAVSRKPRSLATPAARRQPEDRSPTSPAAAIRQAARAGAPAPASTQRGRAQPQDGDGRERRPQVTSTRALEPKSSTAPAPAAPAPARPDRGGQDRRSWGRRAARRRARRRLATARGCPARTARRRTGCTGAAAVRRPAAAGLRRTGQSGDEVRRPVGCGASAGRVRPAEDAAPVRRAARSAAAGGAGDHGDLLRSRWLGVHGGSRARWGSDGELTGPPCALRVARRRTAPSAR